MPNPSPVLYLGILGTLAVNRLMLILYGSARLLPERVRSKHDLKPSLADLRPMFQQDWDLCDSSAHVGWPGGPGRSLILKQICSGLLKAPLLQGRGSLLASSNIVLSIAIRFFVSTLPVFALLHSKNRSPWSIAVTLSSVICQAGVRGISSMFRHSPHLRHVWYPRSSMAACHA